MKTKEIASKYIAGEIGVKEIADPMIARIRDSGVISNNSLINVIIENDDKWRGVCSKVNPQILKMDAATAPGLLNENGHMKLMLSLFDINMHMLAELDPRLKRRIESAIKEADSRGQDIVNV